MARRKIVEAMKNLAERLESGSTAIGDFLRADPTPRGASWGMPSNLNIDPEEIDALRELSCAAKQGHSPEGATYPLIDRQLCLIGRGLITGNVDERFFNAIGNSGRA